MFIYWIFEDYFRAASQRCVLFLFFSGNVERGYLVVHSLLTSSKLWAFRIALFNLSLFGTLFEILALKVNPSKVDFGCMLCGFREYLK